MAQQARVTFRYGTVRLMRDAPLGTGAYGEVCKATLDELPCAAKLLHPILVNRYNPRNRTKFEQECRFLSEIRHPNIVQYLGVEQDGQTGLPVLLMELMDDSLTHFLEQSKEPLAYHVQVNISHDIALAVAFLHLNNIVHRDLSSNNVLLIGDGNRAKVADFGMSRLVDVNPEVAGLTKCPGTPAYMAPEALLDPPVYTEKLDCFQAGVLMIQTITRKFPDPGPAMNRVNDAKYPTGWTNAPVPEMQRRQNHLSLIPQTHPMLHVALDCLKDRDHERLSAKQICQGLSALKEAPQYVQSLKKKGEDLQEKEQLIQQLKQENEEKSKEVVKKEKEVREMERELRGKERNIEYLQSQLQQKKKEIREKEGEVREKERDTESLQDQLQQKERKVREKEREIREKERDIESLQSQLQQKEREVREMTKDHVKQVTQLHQVQAQLEKELVPLRKVRAIILAETAQLQEDSQPEKYTQLLSNYNALSTHCVQLQKSLTEESVVSKRMEEANRELQQQLHEATNEKNLQTIRERMEHYQKEWDQAKTQLAELQVEVQTYQEEAVESQETIAGLQKALDESSSYQDQEQADMWQQEIDALSHKIEEYEKRMKRYREERNTAQIMQCALEQQVATLQSTVEELQNSRAYSSYDTGQFDSVTGSASMGGGLQVSSSPPDDQRDVYSAEKHSETPPSVSSEGRHSESRKFFQESSAATTPSGGGYKPRIGSGSSKSGGIVVVKMKDGITRDMVIHRPMKMLNPKLKPAVIVKRSAGKYETGILMYVGPLDGKEMAGVRLDLPSKCLSISDLSV